ncbi:hypothetical protein A1F99_075080 [Pyrenophora tritici-repentis]|nr:hypothetical protein A1F99_075080 [Pyrenophora tritici-repentis]
MMLLSQTLPEKILGAESSIAPVTNFLITDLPTPAYLTSVFESSLKQRNLMDLDSEVIQ